MVAVGLVLHRIRTRKKAKEVCGRTTAAAMTFRRDIFRYALKDCSMNVFRLSMKSAAGAVRTGKPVFVRAVKIPEKKACNNSYTGV
jgi:hypothetical protein